MSPTTAKTLTQSTDILVQLRGVVQRSRRGAVRHAATPATPATTRAVTRSAHHQPASRYRISAVIGSGLWQLAPPRSRVPWLVWGVILQVLGLGSVVVVMWRNIGQQGIVGHLTAAMVKFAWHSQLHTRSGLIVLIAGSAVYGAGSVVMARPYVSSPAGLFVAVPIAAVAGMLVFGILVVILWLLFLIAENNVDLPDFGGSRRRRPRQ